MKVIVKDKAFNRIHVFENIEYVRLQSHKTNKGYEITSFKMYNKDGTLHSGTFDDCDEMIVDDFINI